MRVLLALVLVIQGCAMAAPAPPSQPAATPRKPPQLTRDTVVLRSGMWVEGELVKETDDAYTVRVDGTCEMCIQMVDVARIERRH